MVQVPAGLSIKKSPKIFGPFEIWYNNKVIGKIDYYEEHDRGYIFEVNFSEKPNKEVYDFFKSRCADSSYEHWKSRFPRPFDISFDGYACLRLNGELIYTKSLGSKPEFTIYENVEIQEETHIPGTDIVLEKGDLIRFGVR